MLAQNFKSASALGITEPQKEALMKTLVLLETGKLVHEKTDSAWFPDTGEDFTGHFNMRQWNAAVHGCGTVACIGGTAELVGKVSFQDDRSRMDAALTNLFMPEPESSWNDITPTQAAIALRSYLTTGDARWDLAVA